MYYNVVLRDENRGLGRQEMPLNAHKAFPPASFFTVTINHLLLCDCLFVAVFHFSPSISKLKKRLSEAHRYPEDIFFIFFFSALFRIRACEK